MNKWGIYKILNNVNNKFYIGSSQNLKKRLYEHKRLLRLGKHENLHLQNAWTKYSESAFVFVILEEIVEESLQTNEYLRELETKYIQDTKCYLPEIGYNFIPSGIGTLNLPCSEEKRKKISESNKGNIPWNKNIPMSSEQIKLLTKVKAEKYGKRIDVYSLDGTFIETLSSIRETNRKYKCGRNTIQDSCKNLTYPKMYVYRYHGDSLETIGCNKIQETKEDKQKRLIGYREKRGKKIDVYDTHCEFLETCISIEDCAEKYSTGASTIRNQIKKHCKPSGNYIFREENNPIDLYVYNIYLNSKLIYRSIQKQDITMFLFNKPKMEYKIFDKWKDFTIPYQFKEYILKCEIAPNKSDLISATRQSELISEVSNEANGKV